MKGFPPDHEPGPKREAIGIREIVLLTSLSPNAPRHTLHSMDAHTYPGKGLSLPQLVFALNEELKRVAYSPL